MFTGQRIIITRGNPQAQILKEKLEALGANAQVFPVIEFKDPVSFEKLDQAISKIGKFDWIVFASQNAVSYFLKRIDNQNVPNEALQKLKIGAIGKSTANHLRKFGFTASYSPSKFIAENFIDEFPDLENIKGKNILWPRTNVGRTLIGDKLSEYGANVTMVEAYRTELPSNLEELSIKLFNVCNNKSVDLITVASSQTARNLSTVLKVGMVSYAKSQGFIVNPESVALDASIKSFLSGIAVASIGPITTQTTKEVLGKVDLEASEHTVDGLIEAIGKYFKTES